MTPSWSDDSINVTDARAMRALAHPVRTGLLAALRRHGARSVGMLAELVDEAPASVSYHLSTLAKYGFVAEAPELARDRRESWWRATSSLTNFDPATILDDPERLAASNAMREHFYRGHLDALLDGLAAEPQLGAAWVAASTHSDTLLHLTVEELAELKADLDAVFDRWTERSHPDTDGAAAINLIVHAFRRQA